MRIYILDGQKMTSREKTHDHIAEVLGFPEYYGGNLDALEDCLSDMPNDTYIEVLFKDDAKDSLGKYADKIFKIIDSVMRELHEDE